MLREFIGQEDNRIANFDFSVRDHLAVWTRHPHDFFGAEYFLVVVDGLRRVRTTRVGVAVWKPSGIGFTDLVIRFLSFNLAGWPKYSPERTRILTPQQLKDVKSM